MGCVVCAHVGDVGCKRASEVEVNSSLKNESILEDDWKTEV